MGRRHHTRIGRKVQSAGPVGCVENVSFNFEGIMCRRGELGIQLSGGYKPSMRQVCKTGLIVSTTAKGRKKKERGRCGQVFVKDQFRAMFGLDCGIRRQEKEEDAETGVKHLRLGCWVQ
jgi:hypothetical protein